MTRTLIIVRLDRADPVSQADAAARYAGIRGHDVVLCTSAPDAAPRDAGMEGILLVDRAALDGMALYAHPDSVRRCRDYCLYVAAAARPDYDRYWLVDTELFINTLAPGDLFTRTDAVEADLLAPRLSPRGPNWAWGKKMQAFGERAHGCQFSIVRLSRRAVALLLRARQVQSAMMQVATVQDWPNDEAMVPTTLMSAGLECLDLNDGGTACYTEDSIGGSSVFDIALLAASGTDGLIYYPACDMERWADSTEARLASAGRPGRTLDNPAAIRTPDGARQLDRLGHACLDHPVLGDAALAPLLLAERLLDLRPWQPAPASRPPAARAEACRASLDLRFGVVRGQAALATVHRAVCRLPRHSLGFAKATDFECSPGLALGTFPRNTALPYAYDLDSKELLLTLHASLAGVLGQPFLYAAQRETARVVAKIPLANLAAIYGERDLAASPVLVFSIGRTGSTLFKKLIGCVTPRSISEPDTLTQLAENGRLIAALPADERHAMIYYAIAPLFDVRLPGAAVTDVPGRCVIKLRSQANGVCGEIARVFPAAKYVFMLRERRAWARSTFRSFGLSPDNVVNRLLQALHALQGLQRSEVDLSVVYYEDIVADPYGAVARLTGADPADDPVLYARVSQVAAADSQAGHGLSRARTGLVREGEEAWMVAFEAAWVERRPGSLLEGVKEAVLF